MEKVETNFAESYFAFRTFLICRVKNHTPLSNRLQAEADSFPPASPAARSVTDFEGFGVSPPRRDVELENAEDAVRAAAAKIGAKVAPPSTTVDVEVETK